jgi:hypothetical protein
MRSKTTKLPTGEFHPFPKTTVDVPMPEVKPAMKYYYISYFYKPNDGSGWGFGSTTCTCTTCFVPKEAREQLNKHNNFELYNHH